MSKILRVSESDYRIKVKDTGTITLDTGVEQGTVVITGDLLVKGNTTTVDTANLTIEDNIILLNKGETGAGVTEETSGLEIDRGSLSNAQFIWDETVDKFTIQTDDNTLVGMLLAVLLLIQHQILNLTCSLVQALYVLQIQQDMKVVF